MTARFWNDMKLCSAIAAGGTVTPVGTAKKKTVPAVVKNAGLKVIWLESARASYGASIVK